MGELRNCPKCGKVFILVNRNLCTGCIQEEEEKFEEVRSYLKRHPGASIEQIAEAFEVEENVVIRWLREGRIEDARIGFSLTCQSCGSPISIGNLCTKCAKALTAQMLEKVAATTPEPAKKTAPKEEDGGKKKRRMYVLDRFK